MDWFFRLPTEMQAMLVLTWGMPYVALVLGLLVPGRYVKLWMNLYFQSEESRQRSIAVMERSADAIETASEAITRAFGPLDKESPK
jgi:cytochrome c-type biogenesis protein CcmH/NrfF